MTDDTSTALRLAVATLPSAQLDDIQAAAALATRVDRKYLVLPHVFHQLAFDAEDRLAALEIEGQRTFLYETVYFDTETFDSYHDAARGRRRRFKIRTRSYLDSGLCQLELKQTGGRGETVKVGTAHDINQRHQLTPQALKFIEEYLSMLDRPDRLRPVLTTTYLRSTLVDFAGAARVTCDTQLHMADPDEQTVSLASHILVETKSSAGTTLTDRLLWGAGQRPVTISKFGVGMALLHPELRANKWHRTLGTYFGRPSPVSTAQRHPGHP